VNLDALRSLQSKLSIAFVAAAALLLGSCGGGGAAVSPTASGALALLPSTGSLYAGVPYTFTVAGGRKPFLIVSSEQTLLPLNFTLDGTEFTVVPFNPGVIDVGLDPAAVPSRSVNIQVRDSANQQISATYNVLQNFFTGYSIGYQNTCATAGTSGAAPQACSGLDSIATLTPTTQGALYGNKALQFDKVRGDYQFVVEDPAVTPQLVDQLRTSTDQNGRARVRMRITVGAVTQIATYKVTDLKSGATADQTFLIVQQQPSGTITVLPSSVSFTGATSAQCGSGSAQVLVLDGAPPYTLLGPSNIGLVGQNPNNSIFYVVIPSGIPPSNGCPTGSVVVSDTQGRRATVDVKSIVGSGTPPPIVVSPSFVAALTCTSNTATVAVIGGIGPLSTISNHPRVTAGISGNSLTVTRAPSGDTTTYPTSATIVVTDGATLTNLSVPSVSAFCP
jgi:hypothetical protein